MAIEIIAPTGEVEVRGRRWEAVVASDTSEVRVESGTAEIDVSTGVMIGGTPYEGSYEADARFTEQLFQTARKTMSDDFAVHAINYTEAPNDSGITVTIGG